MSPSPVRGMLQEASHREQMLENKLATLQRLIQNTQEASDSGWQVGGSTRHWQGQCWLWWGQLNKAWEAMLSHYLMAQTNFLAHTVNLFVIVGEKPIKFIWHCLNH